MKDDATGMALREECEAFARRCEQERKDCEKHVSAFHDTDKKTGGQSKMHAINTSASCLTRAQNMTKEAKKLQDAAVQRVLDLKKSGASDDKIKRADATAVVVRDAAHHVSRRVPNLRTVNPVNATVDPQSILFRNFSEKLWQARSRLYQH